MPIISAEAQKTSMLIRMWQQSQTSNSSGKRKLRNLKLQVIRVNIRDQGRRTRFKWQHKLAKAIWILQKSKTNLWGLKRSAVQQLTIMIPRRRLSEHNWRTKSRIQASKGMHPILLRVRSEWLMLWTKSWRIRMSWKPWRYCRLRKSISRGQRVARRGFLQIKWIVLK